MKYAKSYLDNLYKNINEYSSKVELFRIAYINLEEQDKEPNWYIELREIINWQAQSDRSGVWTYYEVLDEDAAKVVINELTLKEYKEILINYTNGIDKFDDEFLMDAIDKWIFENEEKIYQCLEYILINNKDWFYSI